MMTTVLRKSTVRPWPSVRRPSSRSCSSTLKTSLCAFSTSSKRIDGVRAAADGLGELAAFFVADVAGGAPMRRATVCFSMYSDMSMRIIARSSSKRNSASARAQLGLADAGGPEEQERADGAVRVGEAGAGATHRVRHRDDGLGLADDALDQALLHLDELLDLGLQEARSRGCPSTWRRSRRCPPRRPLPSACGRASAPAARRAVSASRRLSSSIRVP